MSLSVSVLAGLLSLLNLFLSVGVIRRLRVHNELLSKRAAVRVPEDGMLPSGSQVGDFSAQTTDDQHLAASHLNEGTVIGFFATDCPPCQEEVPKFAGYARDIPGGRTNVLAVVVGPAAEATPMVTTLAPVAQVTVEDHDGPLTTAFSVSAFPSACRLTRSGDLLVVAEHVSHEISRYEPARS